MPEDRVLVLSGLDPCGGAGISADIETLNQFGVTSLPIVTSLTVQNTESVIGVSEVDSGLITKQFNHLLQDVNFSVVKVGLIASKGQASTILSLLSSLTNPIIVLDPIISSGSSNELLDNETIKAIKEKLIPVVDVLTPNLNELQILCPNKDEQQAIKSLPCEWVLVTTSDSSVDEIEHRLYHHAELVERFNYTKLPGSYHGSGCTLASAISALLSLGVNTDIACNKALEYTYQTLLNAKSIGKMQYHPNRKKP